MNHAFLKPKGTWVPNRRWSSVCRELGWYCQQLEPSSRALFAGTDLQMLSKKWSEHSLWLIPEFWAVTVVKRPHFHFSSLFQAVANINWWLVKRKGIPVGFTLAGSENSRARTGNQLSWKFRERKRSTLEWTMSAILTKQNNFWNEHLLKNFCEASDVYSSFLFPDLSVFMLFLFCL